MPKILLSQFFITLLMTVMALALIFYAEGYRYNFKTFKVSRTGIASFVTYPKGADIYINDRLMPEKTPYAVNLTPATYDAMVTKDGYQSWQRAFKVDSELVSEFKNIVMFKSDIPSTALTDPGKINLLNAPIDLLAGAKQGDPMIVNDHEIWVGDSLVTRFSTPVSSAIWYPDHTHIVFQQGDEIRTIELDGFNDTQLVKLSSNLPTNFALNNKGTELYFSDNGDYKVATIR